jgi:3-oxoacyl-[acyl-carrier-protein] synthase-3
LIPQQKWFSNLQRVGNIGSASIWVMLDAIPESSRLRRGQKVLCVCAKAGAH